MADHADSRRTKLYDRRGQKVLREDVERIRLNGVPSFAVIGLPPVNQGTVGSENDRNFSTQRNFLEGGTINQTGKKNSNTAKKAVYTAT